MSSPDILPHIHIECYNHNSSQVLLSNIHAHLMESQTELSDDCLLSDHQ